MPSVLAELALEKVCIQPMKIATATHTHTRSGANDEIATPYGLDLGLMMQYNGQTMLEPCTMEWLD